MLHTNDLFTIIRRSGYIAPILIFFPPLFRLPILIGVFLLFLFERRIKLSQRTTFSQTRRDGISQEEVLWAQPLPLWVACLLLTENLFIQVETIPLMHPVCLSVTRQGYSLVQQAESQAKWLEYCLEGGILLLFMLPMLSVFIPFTLIAISIASGALLSQIYLRRLSFDRHLRVEKLEILETLEIQELPRVRTFCSYLPQENVPAFARQSWRSQEIYLDARFLHTASNSIMQTLLTHEQGHIALGHTRLLFLLHCCRYITIIVGLLILSIFSTTLAQASGPGAIPWLLVFIAALLAPDIVKLINQSTWEQQADQWTALRLGQGAVNIARLYVTTRYQGR